MTREESIKRFRKEVDKKLKWSDFSFDFEMLLHSIYDDFESRTCENCKYLGYRKSDNESYCILNNTTYRNPVKESFGCNKWSVPNEN